MTDRHRAIDAVDLLNDFIGDIVTGTMVFREYEQRYRAQMIPINMMIPIQKMCVSHLVLTLSKWLETHQKYHDIVPDDIADVCRELKKNILRRGIPEFRNKCIGHIWDKSMGRPLVQSEIMARLDRVVEGNIGGFLSWMNSPPNNSYPDSVLSIVEKIRDDIVKEYKISPHEVIER